MDAKALKAEEFIDPNPVSMPKALAISCQRTKTGNRGVITPPNHLMDQEHRPTMPLLSLLHEDLEEADRSQKRVEMLRTMHPWCHPPVVRMRVPLADVVPSVVPVLGMDIANLEHLRRITLC